MPNDDQPTRRPSSLPPAVRRPGAVVAAAVVLVSVLGGLTAVALAGTGDEPRELGLSELDDRIAAGDVTALTLDDRARTADAQLGDGSAAVTSYPEGFSDELVERALAADVAVEVEEAPGATPLATPLRLLAVALVGIGVFLLLRHRLGGALPGGRHREATPPQTRFGDVAGAEEITAELQEVVEYLREPDRFAHLGARAPKGVLLVGPPGTGKTLLARAVAGEAGVPFYALSGSDFIEKFVGVGAARVRNVFGQARKAGRAIIFIDELDAVGKRRGAGLSSNEERENTLNQLLVEMDGFAASEVVVLAATNRPDVLDDALTRPGRFDRRVVVGAPDRGGREAILRLHLAGRPVADGVDLAAAARRTPGFTGADIANLVNQAALAAARGGAPAIGAVHLDAAIATVMLGPERRSLEVLQRDREITAWHEAGHTVAALVDPHAMDPAGVSIVPRGHAGGVTWMTGDDHQFLLAPQARAQLLVSMAGRAAEELVYGAAYTQGASGDLQAATELATRMAAEFGMSDLVGPVHIPVDDRQVGETADLVRRAVRELLASALDGARALVAEHRPLLEAVADALLEHESLDAAELRALCAGVLAGEGAPADARRSA